MSERPSPTERFSLTSPWRVLVSYAVGAWLVLQLAETFSSLLGLPLWFGPAVVIVLAAGAPLALVASVVQGPPRPDDGGVVESGPERLRRMLTWTNVGLGGLTVAVVVVAVAVANLALRQVGGSPWSTLQAQGVMEGEDRVILADFDDSTEDGAIGESVAALFRVDLGQSPEIVVLEPTQVEQVLRRMQRPLDAPMTTDVALEAARRQGIKGVVAGEVLSFGEELVVSVRLVSAADGSALVQERATASRLEDVPEVVDGLSARLRERIGESLRSIRAEPPLAEVTTSSLQALGLYARAERANDAGDLLDAVRLLDEAIGLDSTFAMAHRKLGVLLLNSGTDAERSMDAFRTAYELRERLTEREALLAEAAYHTYLAPDTEEAIRSYRAVLDRYPADVTALNNLGLALQGQGRLEEAAAVYWDAVEQDARLSVLYGNAIPLFYSLGMIAEAESAHTEFVADDPEHPSVLRLGAALAVGRGEWEEAEALLLRAVAAHSDDPLWGSGSRFQLGGLLATRGRMAEAMELYRRANELAASIGFGAAAVTNAQFEAETALVFFGERSGAVSRLRELERSEAWQRTDVTERDRAEVARVYAAAGSVEDARRLLDGLSGPTGELAEAAVASANGWIAVAEGRHRDAVVAFTDVGRSAEGCPLCGLRDRAWALELAGDTTAAIESYVRYLETPMLQRWGIDATDRWRVLEALARLYAAVGEGERALDTSRRLRALWADADPEVLPRVEHVWAIEERITGR